MFGRKNYHWDVGVHAIGGMGKKQGKIELSSLAMKYLGNNEIKW